MTNRPARHRKGEWEEEEILLVAQKRLFLVHKYRDLHIALRKQTRRMRAEGKIVYLWEKRNAEQACNLYRVWP